MILFMFDLSFDQIRLILGAVGHRNFWPGKIGNCSWKSEIVLENRKLFLKIGNCSWKSEIILENRKLFLKIGNCSWKSEIILENRKLFLKFGNYSWKSEIFPDESKISVTGSTTPRLRTRLRPLQGGGGRPGTCPNNWEMPMLFHQLL